MFFSGNEACILLYPKRTGKEGERGRGECHLGRYWPNNHFSSFAPCLGGLAGVLVLHYKKSHLNNTTPRTTFYTIELTIIT